MISFLLTVFVKLLSSTCDTLQLPLHVVPLLNFLKRNTQVITRKKSSLNSSSSQGRTVLWSELVICLFDEFWKSLSFHIPQPPAVAELPPELLCKSNWGQQGINFATQFYSGRDARQQHSAAPFCCSVPCIIIPLVYTSSDCFPKGDMGSQVTMQRRTLITGN